MIRTIIPLVELPWWFSMVWNWLPWWSFLAVAAILIAIFWQPVLGIWNLLPKPVKAGLIFIGSIIVAVQYGRNRGQRDEQNRRAAGDARAIKTRDGIDAKVNALPDGDIDRNLRNRGELRDD